MKKLITLSVLTCAMLLTGCATMSPEELAAEQNTLNTMGDEAVAALIKQTPKLKSVFDEAIGHMVVDMKVIKVPIVGGGGGKGVVIDKRTNERSYVKVRRLDVGGGYGARTYKTVVTFTDPAMLEKAKKGTWIFQAGAEAAAGSASVEGAASGSDKGFSTHVLSEGGAAATVTIRTIRLKPYLE